jgi:hypothetical protein
MVYNNCYNDSKIVEILLVDYPKIMRYIELSPKMKINYNILLTSLIIAY